MCGKYGKLGYMAIIQTFSSPSLYLGDVAGRDGKLGCPVGKSGHPVGKLGVICVCNSGSAHNCGCVVNGRNARAAI
jgi:hypothetical protein